MKQSERQARFPGGRSTAVAYDLVLVSFLVLFLEVLLIRWIGSEVRVIAYFKNMVLLACILGIGIGCAAPRRELGSWVSLATLAMLAFVVKPPAELLDSVVGLFSDLLATVRSSPIWLPGSGRFSGLDQSTLHLFQGVSVAYVLLVFLLIIFVFVPLGQRIGQLLSDFDNPVLAYTLNVLSSLAGVMAFSLLAWVRTPPWIWFLVVLVLYLWFMRSGIRLVVAWIGLGAILLAGVYAPAVSGDSLEYWSPYHKLSLEPVAVRNDGKETYIGHRLRINETYYQHSIDMSNAFVRENPALFPDGVAYDQYNIPYRFVRTVEDVLIVGAGLGNDVAAAIRNGAARIDAVEIDPVIRDLGVQYHPERPYGSDRVRVAIDDARAFFKKADRKYDMIVFGLLDSHTLASEYSNIRLDHYVYTRESFEEAKKLLKPGGTVVLSFEVQRPWIGARIGGMLANVFGGVATFEVRQALHRGVGGFFFVTGVGNALNEIEDERLRALVTRKPGREGGQVPETTDDWPYLYLEKKGIPGLDIVFLAILGTLAAGTYWRSVGSLRVIRWDFFFLGAGFMLVEVNAISRTALLFGTTWVVNVSAISAILLAILLANIYVMRWGARSRALPFAGILIGILGAYVVPVGWFFRFGIIERAVLATALYSIPVLFAGIVFARLFAEARQEAGGVRIAFGSNLLGAVVGGMSETLAYAFGMRALMVVAAAFYVAAALGIRMPGLARET